MKEKSSTAIFCGWLYVRTDGDLSLEHLALSLERNSLRRADFLTSPIDREGARRVNILHRMFKSGLSWRFYCSLKRFPFVTRRRGLSLKSLHCPLPSHHHFNSPCYSIPTHAGPWRRAAAKPQDGSASKRRDLRSREYHWLAAEPLIRSRLKAKDSMSRS